MTAAGRQAAFILILALHLLAIWLLPQRTRLAEAAAGGAPIMLTFVRPAPPQRPVQTAPSWRDKQPLRRAVPAVTAPAAPVPFTVIPSTPVAQAPVEQAAPQSAAEILQQARTDIGKIDRALRKQSPDLAVREITLQAPKLETALAAAFRERGPVRVQELVLADGTRVSKMGNMCAFKESNGLTGGRDAFKDGIKTRWQTCPK
ncbi:MAG TPA: hypothetical protein VGC21_24680 [Telluria sp.]|jgi:hypothetical protein